MAMLTEAFQISTTGEAFRLREVRPRIFQLIAPIFHEDGDMMNIYLEEVDGAIKISDHGMSLMRLSYLFDVDSENKKRHLNDIVHARGAEINQGSIESVVSTSNLLPYIMNYAQLVAEVCNMEILSRDFIANMFYDYLREAIESLSIEADYIPDYQPPGFGEINIDHAFFRVGARRPVFLYGVKDTNKAQQTTIDCLQMEIRKVPNRSIVVFDDIDTLTQKSKIQLLNTAGKAYDLDGFRERGKAFIEEELSIA